MYSIRGTLPGVMLYGTSKTHICQAMLVSILFLGCFSDCTQDTEKWCTLLLYSWHLNCFFKSQFIRWFFFYIFYSFFVLSIHKSVRLCGFYAVINAYRDIYIENMWYAWCEKPDLTYKTCKRQGKVVIYTFKNTCIWIKMKENGESWYVLHF